MATGMEALASAVGLLLVPVLLALPLRIGWQVLVGSSLDTMSYRADVRRILHAGMPLEAFRVALDDRARESGITPQRQRLLEADTLYPLGFAHFILLPALFIFPIALMLAAPVILLAFPVFWLAEFILIRRQVLTLILDLIRRTTNWQIVHIPRSHETTEASRERVMELSHHLRFFHGAPRLAFLGLFAWLIIHWALRLNHFGLELLITTMLYVVLLAVVGVVTAALETDLVWADPATANITPIAIWLDSMLKPVVGFGLVLLLARSIAEEVRNGNAVLFSASVIAVIYAAALVGFAYQWGYALAKGRKVRTEFEEQAMIRYAPLISYDLTRSEGRLVFGARMSMAERREVASELVTGGMTFADLEALPRSEEAGQIPRRPNV
ncbi:MAG: hypothetical protein O3B05_00690 [archaeon]|nr:hypothetical protein [archaeon]